MDDLTNTESIVGKSFEYWQHLYNEGIIENHVIKLRLQHLKYAVDHNLISHAEYYGTHTAITNQCPINYKPCSLMDFGKTLKVHNSTSQQEIIQFSNTDKYSKETCKIQTNFTNISENINQLHESIEDLDDSSLIIEENNINQKEIKKKSKKRRKKSKWASKNIYDNLKTEALEHIMKDEYQNNLSKQIVASKPTVMIHVRQPKKDKSKIDCTESHISTKKKVTLRDVFSEILKKFKMERKKIDMTDSTNKELVKRVQSSLSKYINKPQLTDKLLNKPPFKFIHDIVTNVIRSTNYLSGVFSDEEIISTNVTTKEAKIKFLEKLITSIQSTTNKTISARPSKIVAGLEVSKTLELLIAIVVGIEIKNKEVKEQNVTNTKTKKIENAKIINQNKIKVLEKTKSQEKKIKENTDHDSQKYIQKTNSEDLPVIQNDEQSMETDPSKKSALEFSVQPGNEEVLNTVDNSLKTEEQNENQLQLAMKSKSEKQDSKSIEKTNQENQLRKLSDAHNISKPIRPKSSRPPAPNRRSQSNTYTEIPKHSDSFFSKNDDKMNDIDDNIVTVEVLNDSKSTYESYTEGDGQGQLVSQILQTQLEFNIKKKTDSTKTVEWEGKSVKDQEMLTKEMDTIRQFIQAITKSANPLSKLINNMQENIDQMNRELNYWKNYTEKTNQKLDSQQQVAEEKIKPMIILLEKLKTDIRDELEIMDYCKANILKNKAHINYLVSERFTLKQK